MKNSTMARNRHIVLSISLSPLLIFLLFIGSVSSSSSQQGGRGNNNNNGASFSPVRELGPSLAASVAGGTVIAVRSPLRSSQLPSGKNNGEIIIENGNCNNDFGGAEEDDECIVILFRSPSTASSNGGSVSGGTIRQNQAHGRAIRNDGRNLTLASVFGRPSQTNEDLNEDNQNNLIDNEVDSTNAYNGLTFLPNGPVNFPFLSSNRNNNNNLRILHAPSGLIMAATGFAPDADHILQVAAGRVLSRISVYDAPSLSSSTSSRSGKSVDPHLLVREDLSSLMADAAMSEGGRPLGVQLLVIGQSTVSRRRNNGVAGSRLEIYTVDPSGGFKNWCGSGTAVGRGAERVRLSLIRSASLVATRATATVSAPSTSSSLNDEERIDDTLASKNAVLQKTPIGWRSALDRAMSAAIDALEENDDDDASSLSNNDAQTNDVAAGNYGAIIVFGGSDLQGRNFRYSNCAVANPDIVEQCYMRCSRKVRDQKEMAKSPS